MTDLLQIIRNIVAVMGDLEGLLSGICFLMGFIMTIKALRMAQRRQEMGPGQGTWGSPLSTFIIAALFLGLPTFLDILNVSLFGVESQSASSIFSYAESTVGAIEGEAARDMISGIVLIIQFVGVIAVCRGLYLLNQSAQGGQGPQTFGPGFTFVIAGICATNFPIAVGIFESLITSSG